jgi:multidrug efflux pump
MSNPADKAKQIIREFGISSFAVDNKTVINILSLLIFIGGLMAYNSMPRENFPEVVVPTIYVGTTYPGNSPSDIENLVTRPIEEELTSINGLKKLSSTSVQDRSTIVAEFNTNVEVEKALREVKDAVDRSKKDLPSDLDREPDVFEMDFSEFPVLNINLSGDISMDNLKKYAEYLENEIEKLPEISEVDIKGAQEREVKIDVDIYKMNTLDISFGDIENAIRGENVTISGGDLLTDEFRRSIRVVGEFKSPAEMNKIIVKHSNNRVVYLRDIAAVNFDYEERSSYARNKALPVVSLDVKKRSGENLLLAVDKIHKILETAKDKKFPKNLDITITNDQSKYTRNSVDNLENNIISGVILVVLVLQFFLGLRNAMFVGIAIPLSMLMSFIILSMMNVTLNTMVLFSLVLALGMLVDNGIVVVENSYRLMSEGFNNIRGAKEGVGEVAIPIITSTLTTLAAFVPMLFWEGIMGQFMKYLPLTLIIVLSSSLFVALVVNPVLISIYMKVQTERKKIKRKRLAFIMAAMAFLAALFHILKLPAWGNLMIWGIIITILNVTAFVPFSFYFQKVWLVKLEHAYEKVITFSLQGIRPWIFLGGTFALLIGSVVFLKVRAPKVNFFPENQPQYINVFIEFPLGTDIEKTNNQTLKIYNKVMEIIEPYQGVIDAVITNVGEGTSDPMESKVPAFGKTPNKAKITVSFLQWEERKGVNTNEVLEKIRDNINILPGALITASKNHQGPPVGKPISVEVSGENYLRLTELAEGVKKYIDRFNIPGIEELKLDLEKGKPELIVKVDREAAGRYGLTTGQVAVALRTSLFGKEVSKYKEGEDDYPIMLRLNTDNRYDLQTLINQKITFRDQSTGKIVTLPVASVASVNYTSSLGSIKRKEQKRVITIGSNVKEGYNATEINDKIKMLLSGYDMPEGYSIKFGGEQEEQEKAQAFLSKAFMIAVFLIFLIIVAQFNNLHAPLIIMLSVLFSTIGVFMGLAVFRMDVIVLMTGIGIISLAGIVVNNAIVLMDCVDLIRARKRAELGGVKSGNR